MDPLRCASRMEDGQCDDEYDEPVPYEEEVVYNDTAMRQSVAYILSQEEEMVEWAVPQFRKYVTGFPMFMSTMITLDHMNVFCSLLSPDSPLLGDVLIIISKLSNRKHFICTDEILPRLRVVLSSNDPTIIELSLNIIGNMVSRDPAYVLRSGIVDSLGSMQIVRHRTLKLRNWVLSQFLINPIDNYGVILTELAKFMDTGSISADAHALLGFQRALEWGSAEVIESFPVIPNCIRIVVSGKGEPMKIGIDFVISLLKTGFQNVSDLIHSVLYCFANIHNIESTIKDKIMTDIMDNFWTFLQLCISNETTASYLFGHMGTIGIGNLKEILPFKDSFHLLSIIVSSMETCGRAFTLVPPEQMSNFVAELLNSDLKPKWIPCCVAFLGTVATQLPIDDPWLKVFVLSLTGVHEITEVLSDREEFDQIITLYENLSSQIP